MRALLVGCLLAGAVHGLIAEEADPDNEPLRGSWRVTTVVQGNGRMTTPQGMDLTFTAAGELRATVVGKGTTSCRFRVQRRSPHALVLAVTDQGRTTRTVVELSSPDSLSLITDGTTLLCTRDPHPPPEETTTERPHAHDPPGDQPLAGVVDGEPWSLVAVAPNLLQDSDGWHVVLRAEPVGDPRNDRRPQLLVTVPRTTGTWDLSPAFTITFYTPPATNRACGTGTLTVRSLHDDEVVVALNAWLDDSHHVRGVVRFDPRRIPAP